MPAKQLFFVTSLLLLTAAASGAEQRYYRYINEDGVTVMDSRIPPRYVKHGYEVVTVSGKVLEVVPPAPSPEEAEKLAAQRERQAKMAEMDEYLLRRYSTVAEIEAAKKRKLADFEASMSMLRGNASGIEAQIQSVEARAANIERSGRPVPDVLLDNLEALKEELAKAREQIELRLEDKKELQEKFDREIERFAQIRPES